MTSLLLSSKEFWLKPKIRKMGLHGNYRKQTLFLQSVNLLTYFQLCGNFSLRQTGKKLDTVEEDT